MAEHTYARFFTGPFLDFRRDQRANPAEPGLAILFSGRPEKSIALLTRAFSHDDEGKFFSLLFALEKLGADAFVAEGDFRDQNDVAAARDAGVRGNPAGVTAHHFEHQDAIVAFGRRAQTVERVRGAGHRRIETEGDDRGFEIIVNRFRNTHDRNAVLEELLGDRERAVTAYADERAQTELGDIAFRAVENLFRNFADFAVAGLGREPPLIRCAENGAAQVQQAVHLV